MSEFFDVGAFILGREPIDGKPKSYITINSERKPLPSKKARHRQRKT